MQCCRGPRGACAGIAAAVLSACALAGPAVRSLNEDSFQRLDDARFELRLNSTALHDAGWNAIPRQSVTGPGESESALVVSVLGSRIGFTEAELPVSIDVRTDGALLLLGSGSRTLLREVSLESARDAGWQIVATTESGSREAMFKVADVLVDRSLDGAFRLQGSLIGTGNLHSPPADRPIGSVEITGRLRPGATDVSATPASDPPPVTKRTAGMIGPDVIVGDLHQVSSYGSSGGVAAYAVGTVSCNIGDAPLKWFSSTNQHPVIGQNVYRLHGGRFEQVGMGWLKHGFFALSETLCSSQCQWTDGTYLGVNCSDPYSSSLNGQQGNLGPRYQVNAYTGAFNYPPANPAYSGILARRIQIPNSDLSSTNYPSALYFAEGQYVTPDDAAAGNQNNNASFRPLSVTPNGSTFTLNVTGTTRRQKPAIRAWRENDPQVVEADVQVPDDGMFIVAGRAYPELNGVWLYEYAVYNMNSHRSAKSFTVPVDPAATITDIGFHDINYHSGEPFSGLDWFTNVSNGYITWSTDDFSLNQNANALRWGTLYNFRFRANRPPHETNVSLTLFRPGTPTSVSAPMVGPLLSLADCNENGIADGLDIENGTSQDCDGDVIPDECESFALAPLEVASGLDQPVYAASPPGDARLFIVEKPGRIKILSAGAVLATPYLDISGQVDSTAGRGLLSIAFHPNFAATKYVYLHYNNLNGDTVIARYQSSQNMNIANPASATVLKTISQDLAGHSGGQLQFGSDGNLYAGIGDGGGINDPFNRAQDTGSLLGKLLRLDVNNPPTYVPDSNPFVGPGLPLDEIWAVGLRHPWRFSFDRQTGDLYLPDVGQSAREEINFQQPGAPGGRNYGWRCTEGSSCTGLSGCVCNGPILTAPIYDYAHAGGDCSIVGGYVYRGCALPNLLGRYLYADGCSGRVGSFRVSGGVAVDHEDLTSELSLPGGPIPSIVSFGENADGELFIVSSAGSVYRVVPDPDGGAICGNDVLEQGEFCDDGNTQPGDGCDENCAIETGPSNDRCSVPAAIGDGAYAFDINGAGTDGPADSDACTGDPSGLSSDVWYCYTAPRTGTVTVSTCDGDLDSVISVYPGCECPQAGESIACNNNACGQFGTASSVTFESTACTEYMIRVGGLFDVQGASQLQVTCTPPALVFDCDGNGVEDADDILCGNQHDSNDNLVPDTCETDGDPVRGGRLYDKWWVETGASPPVDDHPLWAYRPDQVSNSASSEATWTCRECHGWDYKGVQGQYGTGPHRTGFPGTLGTTLDASELFDLLKEPPSNGGGPGIPNGHDFGTVLPDARINDLVAFILVGAIDTAELIDDESGEFNGDPGVGEQYYTTAPSPACILCHGADGTNINFGTESEPEYVGTIALENPWELLHKIRFGQPAAPMPSWMAGGGTPSGAADIGRYVQLNFPSECTDDQHCDDQVACTIDSCNEAGLCDHVPDSLACTDDGVFCNGSETCDAETGCASPGNPCSEPTACNELQHSCGCLPPIVSAAGPRYLAISPQPAAAGMAMALVITPQCAGGQPKYVGTPFGQHNVALVVEDPQQAAYLTPSQWGDTVYVTGTHVAPEVVYSVAADCGVPQQPVITEGAVTTTPPWGDVGGLPGQGDGQTNVIDIGLVVDGVKGLSTAPPLYRTDLYGCVPNQRMDVIDIGGVVDAVKGFGYRSGTNCPGPCW